MRMTGFRIGSDVLNVVSLSALKQASCDFLQLLGMLGANYLEEWKYSDGIVVREGVSVPLRAVRLVQQLFPQV